MSSITGYRKELPIKKGDKVRIKKGTLLRSMHPQKDGKFPAGRTYTVTVHHTMPGRSMVVGHIYKLREGESEDRQYGWGSVHWRDLYRQCKALGIDYGIYGPPGTLETAVVMKEIMKSDRCELRDSEYGHREKDIWLHLDNPTVVWPGSGGYWTEAEINDVEKVA